MYHVLWLISPPPPILYNFENIFGSLWLCFEQVLLYFYSGIAIPEHSHRISAKLSLHSLQDIKRGGGEVFSNSGMHNLQMTCHTQSTQ
jgi:hypothetical protein